MVRLRVLSCNRFWILDFFHIMAPDLVQNSQPSADADSSEVSDEELGPLNDCLGMSRFKGFAAIYFEL